MLNAANLEKIGKFINVTTALNVERLLPNLVTEVLPILYTRSESRRNHKFLVEGVSVRSLERLTARTETRFSAC